MHNYAEIPDLIKKNLTYLGYKNIDFIFFTEENFKYDKWSQKITNFYRKTFLKDKTYKEKLKSAFIETTLIQKAQNLSHYETIVVMNTDFFSDHFLTIIRTKTKNLVGNHWDGLSRTPQIYSKIIYFDKFFVFDKNDVDESKNIYFLTNFFFDFDKDKKSRIIEQDVFYLGTFVKERFNTLQNLSKIFTQKGISHKIVLFDWQKRPSEETIIFSNKFIAYEENISYVKKSKALLDLKLKDHNGLSFRFFEALHYNKKLITNNSDIKNYDFYRKENIFVIGEDMKEDLKSFIESPYQIIPANIKNKYSFENWFKTLIS